MPDNAENKKAAIVDLGDGLFLIGDETVPHCSRPAIGFTCVSANEVKWEFDTYYVIVTAEGSGNKRHNFHWKRVYKSEEETSNAD